MRTRSHFGRFPHPIVSAGYFSNGNLMVWLSKLFFYDCNVSSQHIRLTTLLLNSNVDVFLLIVSFVMSDFKLTLILLGAHPII